MCKSKGALQTPNYANEIYKEAQQTAPIMPLKNTKYTAEPIYSYMIGTQPPETATFQHLFIPGILINIL